MSRFLKVMIALLAIAAVAAPAMAEVKLNGYYRLQGTMQSFTADQDAQSFVDQRLRMKVTDQLNDNVSVVWYGEYDAPFGVTGGKTVAGAGGKLSADGVGIETKNFYVDFKVPNSSWAVRTGIQGFGWGRYEDFVTDDDMNGIKASGTAGPVKLTAGWFKWDEGAYNLADDIDFYTLQGEVKANDQITVGATVGLVANNSLAAKNGTAAKTDDYYYGVYADFTPGKIGFSGDFLVRSSSPQDNGEDGTAYMLNLYAKAALGSAGHIKAHAVYIPADDSDTGVDRFSANQAAFEFHNDNLQIFGTDVYYNNGSQGGLAAYASYAGYGLMGLAVSGDYKLPEAAYLKYGVGYFMVADDAPDSAVKANGSDLGTEVSAMVGKKFAEKYDLSLRGSYGFMGDYYGDNVDDAYKVVTMLNVSF